MIFDLDRIPVDSREVITDSVDHALARTRGLRKKAYEDMIE